MAKLLWLPNELLYLIAKGLSPKSQFGLAVSCQDLWSLLNDRIAMHRVNAAKLQRLEMSDRHAWKMLYVILKQPRLGELVHEFRIQNEDIHEVTRFPRRGNSRESDEVPGDVMARILKSMNKTASIYCPLDIHPARYIPSARDSTISGGQEAVRTHIVTLLPNLEAIEIIPSFKSLWAHTMLKRVGQAYQRISFGRAFVSDRSFPLPFRNLVEAKIGNTSYIYEHNDASWVHWILRIPSLRTFLGVRMYNTKHGTDHETRVSVSNVKTLILQDSHLNEGSLVQELQNIACLEKFYYHHEVSSVMTQHLPKSGSLIVHLLRESATTSLLSLRLSSTTITPPTSLDATALLYAQAAKAIIASEKSNRFVSTTIQDISLVQTLRRKVGDGWNDLAEEIEAHEPHEMVPEIMEYLYSSQQLADLTPSLLNFTKLESLVCEWADIFPTYGPNTDISNINFSTSFPKTLQLLALNHCPGKAAIRLFSKILTTKPFPLPLLEALYIDGEVPSEFKSDVEAFGLRWASEAFDERGAAQLPDDFTTMRKGLHERTARGGGSGISDPDDLLISSGDESS